MNEEKEIEINGEDTGENSTAAQETINDNDNTQADKTYNKAYIDKLLAEIFK